MVGLNMNCLAGFGSNSFSLERIHHRIQIGQEFIEKGNFKSMHSHTHANYLFDCVIIDERNAV